MSKPDQPESEMLDEYEFSGGVRGKYYERYSRGTNVVMLDPDVAAAFPDERAVNEALREQMKKQQQG